jgi:hypothetical protein
MVGLDAVASSIIASVDIQHGPTIGDMYEGLSTHLLRRAVPETLGLQIVEGFVTDGQGNRSGQIDCMLVRGEGEAIPYTDAFVWPVQDVIAVFEIKKTLYQDDLIDAFAKLRAVRNLDRAHKASLKGASGKVDIRSARRAFGETTRLVAPAYDNLDSLSLNHQLIFHGYATEKAFRDSLLTHLKSQLNTAGYGPGSFPQLMISGRFSLGKANGQPYSARMHGEWWPFYFSSRVNPVLLLLEYVWTRLDLEFHIGGLWGRTSPSRRLTRYFSPTESKRAVGPDGVRSGSTSKSTNLPQPMSLSHGTLSSCPPRSSSSSSVCATGIACSSTTRIFFDTWPSNTLTRRS